ncbi:MAG: MarR family transcriptional regulator [Candidatus Cloacimonetes bacterium]|nr:MarR family transcriptional regulator [Candidatus Cloacimonadota bacterium]MCF7814499.1 MarR family transcriptional regulator [Candidatus Cloacimonadota bacterium]MCF7869066.1 MarR family transcriptional regulator [Candidatus Cloacimonadota bacterium]MCF7884461.1 MarR family transcriptional regulator [Candidatus Cloacimonadota bacterium]
MKTLIDKYADVSKELYKLCSKKEMIRRKCLNLGRMECDLLNYLNTVDEPVCMNDLSVEMKVSHSRITRIIDTLVRKKLVRRFPSKRDRRSWLAEITEKGKKTNKQTILDFMNIQKDLINKLPEDKVEEIYEYIQMYMQAYHAALQEKESEL